jgi:hypothetical protein
MERVIAVIDFEVLRRQFFRAYFDVVNHHLRAVVRIGLN